MATVGNQFHQMIVKSAVKQFVADYAKSIGRADVITAVGHEVYALLEVKLRAALVGMIERHPSAFRTLKP